MQNFLSNMIKEQKNDELSETERDADCSTLPTQQEEQADKSLVGASLWGGLTRSAFYTIHKLGISVSLVRAFVKKKAFLYIGANNTKSASYPSPIGLDSSNRPKQTIYAHKGVEFVKGSLLGVAVFGIYDYLILRRRSARWMDEPLNKEQYGMLVRSKTIRGRHEATIRLDSMVTCYVDNPLPLFAHVQAGALAGLIQSLILDAWEIGEYLIHHRTSTSSFLYEHLTTLNNELILRRALHHSLGYATLFGCYEGIRHAMTQSSITYLAANPHSFSPIRKIFIHAQPIETNGAVYDITVVPITTTFIAGGMAGQAHFLLSHYLRQWKIGSLAKKTHHRTTKWKHPHWRQLASAFLPTGLSFVAFQYASELTEQLITDAAERQPRSQMLV